jgi:hypothetical protein
MPQHPTDPPIEREPRQLHPPYDVRDDRFDHLHATNTNAWRAAVRLDRLAALLEPLDRLTVTDYEHRHLEWLAGFDIPTVAVLAALLRRARAARPVVPPTDEETEASDADHHIPRAAADGLDERAQR